MGSCESELEAVVSGATEGLGLQSILVDFGLRGYVAVESDATTFFLFGDLWVQDHVRSWKLELPTCQDWRFE